MAGRDLFVPDELVVAFRSGFDAAAGLDSLLASVGAISAERVHRSLEDDRGNLLTTARGRAEATARRFATRSARGSLAGPISELENAYRVWLAEGADVLAALASIASDPDVVYAEPNFLVSLDATPLPNLPFVPDDRYVTLLRN